MGWQDNTFPDADDPNDVEYMIMYWRKVPRTPCPTGNCGDQDYRLESRQFEHLPRGTTKKQAEEVFQYYVDQRRGSGDQTSRKGQVLFLCKVERVSHITDDAGKVIYEDIQ